MPSLLHLLHTVGAFVLTISVIVFIHEFGHYLVARLNGVRIETFSLGFGRELFGWNDKRGTRWRVSMLPLGGYVRMYGDAGAASTPDEALLASMSEKDRAEAFHFKSRWRKAAIVLAGPVANFLLTIAIMFGLILANGIVSTEPVVGEVMPGSAAESAGFKPGDRVLVADGKAVENFGDISFAVMPNLGTPIVVKVLRDGSMLDITVTPKIEPVLDAKGNIQGKRALLGLKSHINSVAEVGVWVALKTSVAKTYQLCAMTLKVIGQMLSGHRDSSELHGAISMAQMSGEAASNGVQSIIWFIALLSANLGLVNLLPVPMLDGGHLMIYALEGLIGRRLPEQVLNYSFRVGTAILAMLMVYAFYNDLVQVTARSVTN